MCGLDYFSTDLFTGKDPAQSTLIEVGKDWQQVFVNDKITKPEN